MQNWLNNEVIQKLCWKTVQAFSITGNAMPFANPIILDIIHLMLVNFFFRIWEFLQWLTGATNYKMCMRFHFIQRKCSPVCLHSDELATSWAAKKICKDHWMANASLHLPLLFTEIHFSHVFVVYMLKKRFRSRVQKKLCDSISSCCHLSLHSIMAKVHINVRSEQWITISSELLDPPPPKLFSMHTSSKVLIPFAPKQTSSYTCSAFKL